MEKHPVYRMSDYVNPDSKFHIFTVEGDEKLWIHTHDYIEFVYVHSGSAEEWIGNTMYEVLRGDLLIIDIGQTHKFTATNKITYTNILFNPKAAKDRNLSSPVDIFSPTQLEIFSRIPLKNHGGKFSFSGKERDKVELIIMEMQKIYVGCGCAQDEFLKNHLLNNYMSILLTLLIENGYFDFQEEHLSVEWKKLLDFVDNNLEQKITLSFLSRTFFFNSSYLSRMFKKNFGVSLSKYISQRRCERAKEQLSHTNMSIAEIADSLGFSSSHAFYKTFLRIEGISPTLYRMKTQKKNTNS
jgi:AraC-like DNA-binding protein/mannose-6-phosphate isomerase-like protein (cupin superfamily)